MFPKLEPTEIKPLPLPPEVDVEVVTKPTTSAEESLAPTQHETVDQLIPLVQSMDLDKIFVDRQLRAKLESISHPLTILADLVIPTPSRPTYV